MYSDVMSQERESNWLKRLGWGGGRCGEEGASCLVFSGVKLQTCCDPALEDGWIIRVHNTRRFIGVF